MNRGKNLLFDENGWHRDLALSWSSEKLFLLSTVFQEF